MQSPSMAGREWQLLVTLSLLWGGSFFFSEVALAELGPFTVVLGLSLLSTALAYAIYFRILAAAGATNLLPVAFLIPVSALALGTLVLGERPDASAYAGMALIFAGLAAVDGRLASFLGQRGGGSCGIKPWTGATRGARRLPPIRPDRPPHGR